VVLAVVLTVGAGALIVWQRPSEDKAAAPRQAMAATVTTPSNADNAAQKFLFDLVGHSEQELLSLMNRAKQMAESAQDNRDTLEIALVLHGPDIDFFAAPNYTRYQQLVDLAAQLDAYDVIDFKACSVALEKRGFDRPDIPAFIELVPFGPDEIERLRESGYITL
jgi:intracellular sulfur oxidation DsrE/DsrF family protein